MTRPQPRRFMPGSAARMVWKAELRLMAMIASQRSIGKSSTRATCWMPALLTRMSQAPNSASQARTMSAICAGWLMSAPWYATREPAIEHDLRALGGERAGDAQADAAGGPGHESGLAFEHGGFPVPRCYDGVIIQRLRHPR